MRTNKASPPYITIKAVEILNVLLNDDRYPNAENAKKPRGINILINKDVLTAELNEFKAVINPNSNNGIMNITIEENPSFFNKEKWAAIMIIITTIPIIA